MEKKIAQSIVYGYASRRRDARAKSLQERLDAELSGLDSEFSPEVVDGIVEKICSGSHDICLDAFNTDNLSPAEKEALELSVLARSVIGGSEKDRESLYRESLDALAEPGRASVMYHMAGKAAMRFGSSLSGYASRAGNLLGKAGKKAVVVPKYFVVLKYVVGAYMPFDIQKRMFGPDDTINVNAPSMLIELFLGSFFVPAGDKYNSHLLSYIGIALIFGSVSRIFNGMFSSVFSDDERASSPCADILYSLGKLAYKGTRRVVHSASHASHSLYDSILKEYDTTKSKLKEENRNRLSSGS